MCESRLKVLLLGETEPLDARGNLHAEDFPVFAPLATTFVPETLSGRRLACYMTASIADIGAIVVLSDTTAGCVSIV